MLNPLIECYNQCRRGCLALPDSRRKMTLAVREKQKPRERRMKSEKSKLNGRNKLKNTRNGESLPFSAVIRRRGRRRKKKNREV